MPESRSETSIEQVGLGLRKTSSGRDFWLLSPALACLLLGVGIYTAVWVANLVRESFSPALDWDQWEVVKNMLSAHGGITFAQLWAQHNEHRIPFGRLASYIDVRYLGAQNVSL